MRNFKQVVALFSLMIISMLLRGQSEYSLLTQHSLSKMIEIDSINPLYKLNAKNILSKSSIFSKYNPITEWNDYYSNTSKNYTNRKSIFIVENNFRGHKIDSYNPYGSATQNTAIILGVVGEFLKKIQK